ncbi:putative reverse transcriptase domain-containing protein [Tanacetum coccineum]
MSPPARMSSAKYHWGIFFATGLKLFTDPMMKLRMKHMNRRVRIPKGLYPRRIEAKMTKKQVGGKWILVRELTMISKDGEISKFPGYHSSEEEEEEPSNVNGWLIEDEDEPLGYEAFDKEVESNLESTIRKMVGMVETMVVPTKGSWHAIPKSMMEREVKYAASLFVNKALTWWNTQVQARGREATIGMSWIDFKALLVEEFCPSNEMEKLEYDAILRDEILTDEAVSCGTLTKGNKKIKGVEETSKQGGWGNDNKRAKVSKGFVAATPHRNGYAGPHPKCAKCWTHHPEGGPCLVCFNCQKPGHFARNCRMPIKQVAPINAVRGEHEPGTCYECGSREHFRNTCPKLTRAPGQVGNRLTIEGNRNTRNNGNQVKGRAFNVNAVGALQDPNVMTGTFSLNNHYATVLFDYGADFSFISTEFAPLLNVKPSIINPGYVIEVADGKKVEVDRIIHDCKLELGNSLLTID